MRGDCSVIVPVHGRAALTERCLTATLATLPGGCELIVVDDASTDETPALLASYGEAIRVLRMQENVGYAQACNAGAELAGNDALVFLNNDTEPQPGWVQALLRHSERHPAAAVVGAKLLYPTGAIQHAGVAIGQDGYPHNLYAGLPAEHPAVNRSRALQAVTGACMLVTRGVFEQVAGFDPGFRNSLEDVDLCLRVGEAGGEVHYCHEAVALHLESASRGRDDRFETSVARYRERWRERVRRDDLEIYAQDGLLQIEYGAGYPARIAVSPLLAVLEHAGREPEIERMLEVYASQVCDLMSEVVRLTALCGAEARWSLADADRGAWPSQADADRPVRQGEEARYDQAAADRCASREADLDHAGFLEMVGRLEAQVRELQDRLERTSRTRNDGGGLAFTASRQLGYRHLVSRVQDAVAEHVPAGSAVLVISRGDRELVKLDGCQAGHFPQDADGRYLGHHPRDSAQAIAWLEQSRREGAEFLVIPATARWWLDHYRAFGEHLRHHCSVTDLDVCAIYGLGGPQGGRLPAGTRASVPEALQGGGR
jgi:GT2 family glycosyltransferase